MTAMKSGLESNRRAPFQAMGKHRLSQASTKSIILEVPNGNTTRAEHHWIALADRDVFH
jgi:hypothetical protein